MKAPTEPNPKQMSPTAMKEVEEEEQEGEESLGAPQQRRGNGSYQGTTWDLLNTSAYKHNKDIPLWEVKDLHIGEHHKMKHLDLHYTHHKGPIHHLLSGRKSAEGGMEFDDSGSPIPVDMSVYSRRAQYGKKTKYRKGKKSDMSPFKGI